MNIVVNGRFLTQRITGVQRYARELVSALDRLLDDNSAAKITVMSPRLTHDPPIWRNIVLRQVGRLQGHPWEQLELPWYSRGSLLLCPGNTAPLFTLLTGRSVVVTVHDLSYKYFPDAYRLPFRLWYALLTPLIMRYAREVLTVSATEREAIIRHFPAVAPRLHAIANGGWPTSFEPETKVRAIAPPGYILYVGSFSKRKNFPRLIDAACKLIRSHGSRFILVGGTAKSLVQSDIEVPPDVASHITFAGPIDDLATLASYYSGAACLLFPSLYESSGLPPLEAMACGCPVVSSDIAALRERCGDAAIYCDPLDTDSIVAAVERAMKNDDLRSRLRSLGYQRARAYSWERCARQTLDLICKSTD
jgi:glycosyltransferase involved in cell wall biosynthesis